MIKIFRCCKLKAEQLSKQKASQQTWKEECANWECSGKNKRRSSLLSGDTKSAAGSAGRLGLLTSDLVSPEVSETSVSSDLL